MFTIVNVYRGGNSIKIDVNTHIKFFRILLL